MGICEGGGTPPQNLVSYENTPPRLIFMVAAVGTDIALTHTARAPGRVIV
jgi:hypothetical protein